MARNGSDRSDQRPRSEAAALRRRSSRSAGRRPSTLSAANRPSAAGQRRSHRKDTRGPMAVGGAAAEIDASIVEAANAAEASESAIKVSRPEPAPFEPDTPPAGDGAGTATPPRDSAPASPGDPNARVEGADAAPTGPQGIRQRVAELPSMDGDPSAPTGTGGSATPRPRAARGGAEPAKGGESAPDSGSPVPSRTPRPNLSTAPAVREAREGASASASSASRASARSSSVQYSSAFDGESRPRDDSDAADGPDPASSPRSGRPSARAAQRRRAARRDLRSQRERVREQTSRPAERSGPLRVTAEALREQSEQLRQADWHPDDDNPYLQDYVEGPQDEFWFEDEEVSPVVPVRDIGPRKRRTSVAMRNRALVIILGIFAAIAALALFTWLTRTITFTVNGEDATASYGTTLDDYIQQSGLEFTPGNFVSVGGNVLQEGGGDAYAATVNGEPYRPEDAKGLHLGGGEVVELGNGLDVTEDYDVEVVKAEPKLIFDGSVGAISYVSQWGTEGTQEKRTGKQSGEQALGDYIEPPSDTIVTTLNVVPADGRKLVALTFDDGPSEYTPQYLEILARYNARATFFMFGPSAQQYPQMAQQVIAAGHQVCNHTSVHQDLSLLDAEQLQTELRTTFEQVNAATGVPTTVFRPPWASFTHDAWLRSGGVASTSVIWTADSQDWAHPGAGNIVNFALEGLSTGSVILMHDGGYPLSQDLEALPTLIEYLQGQGFELVTLSELLASDPSIPEAVVSCNDPMPEGSIWPTEIGEAPEEGTE